MNHRSKMRLCLCSGGGLLIAAAGAVGLTMMALGATPSGELAVAASTAGSSAVAAAPRKAQAPVSLSVQFPENALKAQQLGIKSRFDGGVAGVCPGALCPRSVSDAAYVCLDQNCDKTDNLAAVACGIAGDGTTANGFARCFDMSVELPNLAAAFEIHSVKWGVQQFDSSTFDVQTITINVYRDITGTCSLVFANAVLLASGQQTVTVGDAGNTYITLVDDGFGGQATVNPGDVIYVEIETTVDGTVGTPGNNYAFRPKTTAAACSDGLIRALDCGIANWLGVSGIGFPDSQFLIQVNGQFAGESKPLCGNGIVEACEECDGGPDCTTTCQVGAGPCLKDEKLTIPTCDALPFKFLGSTIGAGNDSILRASEDLIIGFNIGQVGIYSFDMLANGAPCDLWDSFMYLISNNAGGDPCAGTGVIASNDDCVAGCFGQSCIVGINLDPGEYWIVIEGFGAADAGPVDLHVTSECKPPINNNLCIDRRLIFNGKTPFSTVGATTDGPPGPAGCTGNMGPHNDIWYNYIPDFTGDVTITTCVDKNGGATFDTVLVVYKGCTCPAWGGYSVQRRRPAQPVRWRTSLPKHDQGSRRGR